MKILGGKGISGVGKQHGSDASQTNGDYEVKHHCFRDGMESPTLV